MDNSSRVANGDGTAAEHTLDVTGYATGALVEARPEHQHMSGLVDTESKATGSLTGQLSDENNRAEVDGFTEKARNDSVE